MTLVEDLLQEVSLTSALTVFAICLLLYRQHRRDDGKTMRGPPSLPFVGSLPFIEPHAEKTFDKWSKKYGAIFRVKMGPHDTVVLNGYEAIHQALVKQASQFNGRHQTLLTDLSSAGGHGLFFLDEPEKWKIQRRFGLRALSGTSLHGKSIEERVLEEARFLCEEIRSKQGRPFILETDLSESVSNVINQITMKKRCNDEGNEALRCYIKLVVQSFHKDSLMYCLLHFAPWCRYFPIVWSRYKMMVEGVKTGSDLVNGYIDEHEKELDPKHPTDMIDLFLIEKKRASNSFETTKQLQVYLKDMISAGTETSSSTIRWILFHLILQPQIQEKIHEEIDRVIGREGKVSLDSDLPYVKAVIQEAYRVNTMVPLGIPRRTHEDVNLMGYLIPKNTQIISNLWSVHNDPNLWPDPQRFDPERHLDKERKFVKSEKVIPFSIGPRNCLGENLGRIEIFLFLVCILQKFKVLPNRVNRPSMEGTPGPLFSPMHYKLILQER